MIRFKVPLIIFLILLFGCLRCGNKSSDTGSDLVEYLPEDFGTINMHRITEVQTYVGRGLWEYIDGGAELYHLYNFIQVATAYYGRDGLEIGVDIYQFKTSDDAYGLYSMFRSPGVQAINLGVEGFLAPGAINFVRGEYFVRLTGNDESTASSLALTNLAEELNGSLPGTIQKPMLFASFPDSNRVLLTDKYYADSFLGRKFLSRVYTQDYLIAGDSLTLFITDDESGGKYMSWSEAADKAGRKNPAEKELFFDEGLSFVYDDSFYGGIIIGLKKGRLVGMVYYDGIYNNLLQYWLKSMD
nr:hypothetical protein [candidate division Zixibacteria bacterium]